MVDFQQFFFTILISTLTILIVIFSIFVFKILKELRETLKKVNKILDDMGTITGSIAQPISGLSELVSGFKSGLRIFEVIGKIASRRHDNEDNLSSKASLKEDEDDE